MLVLGIETSCDETSIAIVENRTHIRVNLISSQIQIHAPYGGVVPEIASRKHLENINVLLNEALQAANIGWNDLDAVAVTRGPGLVGALLVGLASAKGISLGLDIPLVGVNHLMGHIYANFLENPERKFPLLALVVSGGHTCLVYMKEHLAFETIGSTLDDAAGEAFDKVARIFGLGYPGGPIIDKLAKEGDSTKIQFPRALLEANSLDFSFSGLKTAVMNAKLRGDLASHKIEDLCASFQEAVVDALVEKTTRAISKTGVKNVVLAGGVACNSRLRTKLQDSSQKLDFTLSFPSPKLCTDNAAMIACVGSFQYERGLIDDLSLDVTPQLNLNSG